VRYENIDRRVWSFERFVTIAKHLRAEHNYNAVQAILSGLHSSPVYRLKKTREAIKKHLKKELLALEKLMTSDNNYSNLRAALHGESPPCIPYLGKLLLLRCFLCFFRTSL
jgi:son of sevenless-like protein